MVSNLFYCVLFDYFSVIWLHLLVNKDKTNQKQKKKHEINSVDSTFKNGRTFIEFTEMSTENMLFFCGCKAINNKK